VWPGISLGGHVGGLIGGVVAGFVLVDVGDRLRSPVLPLLACTGLSALAVFGSIAVA
jgi:membrane associated rhomboid family serine protease